MSKKKKKKKKKKARRNFFFYSLQNEVEDDNCVLYVLRAMPHPPRMQSYKNSQTWVVCVAKFVNNIYWAACVPFRCSLHRNVKRLYRLTADAAAHERSARW